MKSDKIHKAVKLFKSLEKTSENIDACEESLRRFRIQQRLEEVREKDIIA